MAKRRRVRAGNPSKAIGIVRTSTSKQDIGAGAQRAELERWARAQEVELVGVFEDVGVSGSAPLTERPGLISAIAALEEHGAGKLVAVKVDRFARCRFTRADLEKTVRAAGARLVTCDGHLDGSGSEAEEMSGSIQDLLAALELRKIRARNKARAERCIAEGRIHGGEPLFGMRRAADGTVGRGGRVVTLEPDPAEQQTIELIRQLRGTGLSYSAIAKELDSRGVASRSGRPWQAMTIYRVCLKHCRGTSAP